MLGLIIMAFAAAFTEKANFGMFEGVKLGTIICAVINGFLIGSFSKFLKKHFDFQNRFRIQKYFQ